MARGSVLKRCRVCKIKGRTACNKGLCENPIYYISYRVGNKQKRETIGPNKKEAERALNQRITEINHGTYHQAEKITLNDFIDKWLDEHAQPRIKAHTLYKYKNALKCHIRPVLGDFYVAKITPNDIRKLLTKMIKKRSPKTTNNILTMLKTIFKYARRWGYIRVSPTEDVDKYRVERKEMDFLKPDEIQLLLKHCDEPFRTLLYTATLTGMRKGELLGLQWGDIDWNSKTIFVRRTLKWKSRKDAKDDDKLWYFDTPKTRYSVRAITLSAKLAEVLQLHRINAYVNEDDLIFYNKLGKPLDPDNLIKRDFQPSLRMAGLRQIRFHDLRHTFTSILIAAGENPKYIQTQLGHASIQTTMDRYGHLFPVDRVGAGDRLDNVVFSNDRQVDSLKVSEQTSPSTVTQLTQ